MKGPKCKTEGCPGDVYLLGWCYLCALHFHYRKQKTKHELYQPIQEKPRRRNASLPKS